MTVQNESARLDVDAGARVVGLTDRRNGADVAAPGKPVAAAKLAGKTHPATAAQWAGGTLRLSFGDSGVAASIKVTAAKRWFVWELTQVSGPEVQELTFVDIPVKPAAAGDDAMATCALALNLQTRVRELPGLGGPLRAFAYPRTGLVGAKVALIACPRSELRAVLKEVVAAADELPRTQVGGPWAMDNPDNYGSYLFNFTDLTETTVDQWIEVARSLGITQIDFHGGSSFRFGDCRPNPKLYPNGVASVKAVLDRLHAAGILAGLHTYAFFIDKNCPWVTPTPDPRLGKDRVLTLAAPLDAAANQVGVVESTQGMSAITGFFQRNSATVQIDDELIVYTSVSQAPPYQFTGCQRGACGTKAAPHAAGAKVHHLREVFGRFLPDGDSTLLAEVAAKTAEFYNQAGFDMIYLDALDGEDAIAGAEWGWHYGGKFAWEIAKRLQKPALFEMSTFHHHLWFIRSRLGAWDHPTRGHQPFIDSHCQSNATCERMYLPAHLGWWAFKTWNPPQGEPTFADDIEYLCAKALGHNCGLSIMGIDPSTAPKVAALPRLAAIVRQYEELRRGGYFNDEVRARLRQPGTRFHLERAAGGEWQFRPVKASGHSASTADAAACRWTVTNEYAAQPVELRLEALLSAGAYEAADNPVLADFARGGEFAKPASAAGVQAKLESSAAQVKVGQTSGRLTALNTRAQRAGSWVRFAKTFAPPLNVSKTPAMGLWVHGDGQGEVLNIQRSSPPHLSHGLNDHYVVIDFAGWRYVELVEPEAARYTDYTWPYHGGYAIYRENIRYDQVETLNLYLNNLPPGQPVELFLSPLRGLTAPAGRLVQPTVTINQQAVRLPVELASGQYLELVGGQATVYGPQGQELQRVTAGGGQVPLAAGANEVQLTAQGTARAKVTLFVRGEAFGGKRTGG